MHRRGARPSGDGRSLVIARGRTVLVADTAVTEMPTRTTSPRSPSRRQRGAPARLRAAAFAARLLTFGHPAGERAQHVREAVADRPAARRLRIRRRHGGGPGAGHGCAAYPFCRLSGPANVLIMPAFHSASISTKMLMELGGATVIGPMLVGLDRSVQIVPLSANDAQLVNMAAIAAFNAGG